MVSASPWLNFTFLPSSARTSLFSWLPGMHSATPDATISSPSRSTAGDAGPAVDEVAEEDRPGDRRDVPRRRPSYVDLPAERAQQLDELVVAAVDVADDVERAGRSSRWSVHSCSRIDLGTVDLVDAAQHEHLAEALALQAARSSAAALSAGGGSREHRTPGPGRDALRSRHTSGGTSSTIAYRRARGVRLASCTSGLRASGCTFVASITVEPTGLRGAWRRWCAARRTRPWWPTGRSRRRSPACDRSPTRSPRSAGSAVHANVDLPDPDTPTSTTSAQLGNGDLHRENTAICVGCPPRVVRRADRPVSRTA